MTSNTARGGRRYLPYVFTEQGVAMLSSVLASAQAIAVNIEIMRAFVRLREVIISNKELALRLDELESTAELMTAPAPAKKHPIGFVTPDEPPIVKVDRSLTAATGSDVIQRARRFEL